ncbi:hypothetical protein [Sphingomonas sp. SUN039]|uniref:hypothetical protein n=1 Tax=Sphingomonas sp. SUN039 TaxID=2937787 RepID=UPI0021643433|nr:hypothetical protein [Sphingomonas sp. SUN039]UVO55697.1 hypothetical protein M0209_16840 [Sphingomonas sp. SUN039]
MFDNRSRYRDQPQRDFVRADGTSLRYVLPRWIPEPAQSVTATLHRASDSDRLDNLASRYLGLAEGWWLIADASDATHPRTIGATPGENIRIPMPQAGPVKG